MVYVVASSGKQYVVGVGQKVKIGKIVNKPDEVIELDDLLSDKKVKARVIKTARGPKIRTLKFRAKTKYLRRLGHRQEYTEIEILSNEQKSEPQLEKSKSITAKKPTVRKRNVQGKRG